MSTIGLDLGGTSIRGLLLGADDARRHLVKVPVGPAREPATVVARLADLVRELAAAAGPDPVGGVGIGVAGWVRPGDGVVVGAPNLGWQDVPLRQLLEAATGLPVLPLNDLSAVALGEWRLGAARDATDALVVFVGTGVGSGLILGGRLPEGAGGFAGEVGHLPVVFGDGRPCGCGRRGCLETVAGGVHLEQRVREAARQGRFVGVRDAAGGAVEGITCTQIEAAAVAGDPDAQGLWEEVAQVLGGVLGGVVNLLDPGVLVLGGGVMAAAPSLEQRVVARIRAQALPPIAAGLKIVPPALGDPAGVLGAALGARLLLPAP